MLVHSNAKQDKINMIETLKAWHCHEKHEDGLEYWSTSYTF